MLFNGIAAIAATLGLASVVSASSAELPACDVHFTPFVNKGCYQMDTSAFIFRSPADQYNMTVRDCTASCKGNGFRFVGLTYYGVCYCGPELRAFQPLPPTACPYACSGNKDQKCGGDRTISVWEDPTFLYPKNEVVRDDWSWLGCRARKTEKNTLILPYKREVAAGTLSPDTCIEACRSGGFSYAGLLNNKKCRCGTALPEESEAGPFRNCNTVCSGNRLYPCGGREHMIVYHARKLGAEWPCGVPRGPVGQCHATGTYRNIAPNCPFSCNPEDRPGQVHHVQVPYAVPCHNCSEVTAHYDIFLDNGPCPTSSPCFTTPTGYIQNFDVFTTSNPCTPAQASATPTA